MNVNLNANEILSSIAEELKKLPEGFEKEERSTLTKIGKVIQNSVEAELDVSTETMNWTNYDGSKPYKHMRDDVKVTTKKDKLGNSYVIVGGGKLTSYKWHIVNDGSYDANTGRRIPATHFIDFAIKKSEPQINKIINDMLWKVANGK